MILENKVFQKLKLWKNNFKTKCAPKLLILNEKKNPKDSDDSWFMLCDHFWTLVCLLMENCDT